MIITVQHVFDAAPILARIMNENRPLPGKGVYRIARMNRKLQTEWTLIAERYNVLVRSYNHKRPLIDGKQVEPTEENLKDPACVMQDAVPEDKMAEFQAKWAELAAEEIEVAVEPIPLDQICIDGHEGHISFAEFTALGTLVADG